MFVLTMLDVYHRIASSHKHCAFTTSIYVDWDLSLFASYMLYTILLMGPKKAKTAAYKV